MTTIQKLLYLDRDFISGLYETKTGFAPETKIIKTEGLQAGVRIPLFSGSASSAESKSYSVSTIGMLEELRSTLEAFPHFPEQAHDFGKSSIYCWIEGTLTINKLEVKTRRYTYTLIGEPSKDAEGRSEKLVAEEFYFAVDAESGKFALIPTQDYFSSGIASFQELAGTVLGPIELPIKALVRVFSAQTSFKQWIAVPLIILEP